MKYYCDLHLHGRYSRGTSKDLDIKSLEKYARIKGLSLLGTGDFTHPKWMEEINENLKENENGILYTKTGFPFIWQTELSFIYSQANKTRRIHLIVLAPNQDVVKQISYFLLKKGRLDYDGRPIFGMSCIEFTEAMTGISPDIEIIPAHAWTPWYSIFGSMSGFDSIEECFLDKSKYIHAIETGMSSDPAMNWRLSKLDNITLVSNSDSHSFWPWRLGRECNVFEMKELSYKEIIKSIRTRENFLETIEVDPGYGKYHYDGHRNCGISLNPNESKKYKNICPKCRKPLTIGVLHRVEELADREDGFKPKNAIPFKSLIPLSELISFANGSTMFSQKTWKEYYNLINKFGSEFNVLLDADEEELKKITSEKLAELIIKNRNHKLKIEPGYDGEYGKLILGERHVVVKDENKNLENAGGQKALNEFF